MADNPQQQAEVPATFTQEDCVVNGHKYKQHYFQWVHVEGEWTNRLQCSTCTFEKTSNTPPHGEHDWPLGRKVYAPDHIRNKKEPS